LKEENMKPIIIILISVMAVIAVLFVIPLKSVSRTNTVWSEKQLSYDIVNSSASNYMKTLTDLWARGTVNVRNIDNYPGTFTVDFSFKTLKGTYNDRGSAYINPGESKLITGEYNTSLGEDWDWNYNVTPGTVSVPETITQNKRVPLISW
jgi:hypothetical protein